MRPRTKFGLFAFGFMFVAVTALQIAKDDMFAAMATGALIGAAFVTLCADRILNPNLKDS